MLIILVNVNELLLKVVSPVVVSSDLSLEAFLLAFELRLHGHRMPFEAVEE